jgi:hypothetical protein
MNTSRDKWEAFLDPDQLRDKLIAASIYIAMFEVLKNVVVERIETFFVEGVDEGKKILSKDYEREVLSISKSRVYASLEWLRRNGVIDAADLAAFEILKTHRNALAHDLFGFATGTMESSFVEQMPVLDALIEKIERWWIVTFEIPLNPNFHGKDIVEQSVVSGTSLFVRLMNSIALGTPEEARVYLDTFRERWPKKG